MAEWRKIRKNIQAMNKRYLVAVSGGLDSMFLLDFMRRSSVYIEIVHFDHGIREDSINDLALIQSYANEHNLLVWADRSHSLDSRSSEVDARNERWQFIEMIARKREFTHIVTAHHADDQTENVLIRLMRGDPHHALIMAPVTEVHGFYRCKPLLSVTKKEIFEQANRRHLHWNEDYTNHDDRYDRNFIRNTVLPLLETRTNIKQAILTGIEKTRLLESFNK